MKPIKEPIAIRIEKNQKKKKTQDEKPEFLYNREPGAEYVSIKQYGKQYKLADMDLNLYEYPPTGFYGEDLEEHWNQWKEMFGYEPYYYDRYLRDSTQDKNACNTQYIQDPRCIAINSPGYRIDGHYAQYVGTVWENGEPTAYITKKYCKRHPECLYLLYKRINKEAAEYREWIMKMYIGRVDVQIDDQTDYGYITTIDNVRYPLNKKTLKNHPFLIIQRLEHLWYLKYTLDHWIDFE